MPRGKPLKGVAGSVKSLNKKGAFLNNIPLDPPSKGDFTPTFLQKLNTLSRGPGPESPPFKGVAAQPTGDVVPPALSESKTSTTIDSPS